MDDKEVGFRRAKIPKFEAEVLAELEDLSMIKKFKKVTKADWQTRMGFSVEDGRVTRLGKLLANELGITVVLIAQLNRGVEARDDRHPRLSDIRQSGNIEEDADIVFGLYRDEYYNEATTDKPGILESMLLKHRNGPTGNILMKFEGATNRIQSGT